MLGFWRNQHGAAVLTVIAFMGLSIPMVTAALSLSTSLSIDSRVKTNKLKDQYAALGGDQYALRLIESQSSLGTYTVDLNGQTITVDLVDLTPPDSPPPPADNSRRLQAAKQVTPTTAVPNIPTVFVYTITVTNQDDEPESLKKVHDVLPEGFSYVPGSTLGLTTSDPSASGQQLTWDFGSSSIVIESGDSVTLIFSALASVDTGNYCNEAWVEPGKSKTSSGKTARVQVGLPSNDLCPGDAITLTKSVDVAAGLTPIGTPITFTYTITLDNIGTTELDLHGLRDLLPEGFSYVPDSVTGNLTSMEPKTKITQDRQRLDWEWGGDSDIEIDPGETRSLSFDATGVFTGGHWNEAWAEVHSFSDPLYTWPTADVQVTSAVETTTTTSSGTTVYSQVWQLDDDSFIIQEWEVSN